MCILEHLNKSGMVPWLERQVPQLCHSCNTHQVQQSHKGPQCDLEHWTCAKSSWVFFMWVWPWWHALDRMAQTSCTQKHSHSGVSVHVPQIHCHHMSTFLRAIRPSSIVSLSSPKRTWFTSAFFLQSHTSFTIFLFTFQSSTMAVVKHIKYEVSVFDGMEWKSDWRVLKRRVKGWWMRLFCVFPCHSFHHSIHTLFILMSINECNATIVFWWLVWWLAFVEKETEWWLCVVAKQCKCCHPFHPFQCVVCLWNQNCMDIKCFSTHHMMEKWEWRSVERTEWRTQEGKRRESGDVNGEKGSGSMCWLTLCPCPPVQSMCEWCCWQGWMGRTEREDKEEKERKSVLGERRKRKATTPKAQTHKSNKQLFSPFSSFLFDFSPFFLFFSLQNQQNTKTTKQHTNDRQEKHEGTECG